MSKHVNPRRGKTTNWRAGCGRSARPVRREGEPQSSPYPYQIIACYDGCMKKPREPRQPREKYKVRTRLIHGSFPTERWDYDHHVVPPQSSSATFRLTSADRGARGFKEFGSSMAQEMPIYVYDRLDEPTRDRKSTRLNSSHLGISY